jgi:carboxymethylenebutenolidase
MRIVRRILVVLGVLLVTLVLFIAGSILVDAALGSDRLDRVTNTTIPGIDGQPDVRAYVARPPGSGPFPAAIMIHEFYGLNESIIGKAEGLAEEGYLVIAPDTFRGSTTAWIPRAIYQTITSDAAQVNQDLDSVFTWMAAQPDIHPDRIAVLGFCYGGRASLSYSLHNRNIAATVIFYGSPETDPTILQTLPGPVLGIFGGADNSIPLEEVHAFEAGLSKAGIPHEVTVYEGQPHAFLTSMDAIRAGGVQGEAWNQMVTFLDANLKGTSSKQPDHSIEYVQPFAWRYYLMLAFEHALGAAHH